jgi:hypothetical protein
MKGKYITTQIIMACLASEAERKRTAANRLSGIDIDKKMASCLNELVEHDNERQAERLLKVA